MNMDPNEAWNQMTGGKDVWNRADITDQRQTFRFDMMARQLNVTNGQITKQQFLDLSAQWRQRMQNGNFGRGPGGGPGGGMQQGQQPNATGPGGPPPGGQGGFDPNAFAELLFKRYDKNGDGVLNYDEMPDNLKAEKDKFDTNKDGMIDLNEFKEFIKARGEQMRNEMGGGNGANAGAGSGMMPGLPTAPIKRPEEEEPKRVVYRAGKLPKELPPWFQQIDKDGDGQIGLYEWKSSGRPLDEFFKIDRNGDGFLTVEEVLRYVADQNKANGKGSASPGSPGANAGPPNGGGPPGGGSAGPPNGNGGGPRNGGGGGPRNGGGGGRRQRG
jgi:Ca2+-binding EF-hand superfamily protein